MQFRKLTDEYLKLLIFSHGIQTGHKKYKKMILLEKL